MLPPPSHGRVKKVQQDPAETHVVVITSHLFPMCRMDRQARVVQSASPTALARRMIEDDPTILFLLLFGVHSLNTLLLLLFFTPSPLFQIKHKVFLKTFVYGVLQHSMIQVLNIVWKHA